MAKDAVDYLEHWSRNIFKGNLINKLGLSQNEASTILETFFKQSLYDYYY